MKHLLLLFILCFGLALLSCGKRKEVRSTESSERPEQTKLAAPAAPHLAEENSPTDSRSPISRSQAPRAVDQRVILLAKGVKTARENEDAYAGNKAMNALMDEWNPVGIDKTLLINLLGYPTREKYAELEYLFDTGFSGSQWFCALENGIVVAVRVRGLE